MLRSQGLWPINPGSVKITYYAGYKAAELRGQDTIIDASPIWEVVCNEMSRRFLTAKQKMKQQFAGFAGPLMSEKMGDYSYTSNGTLLQSMIGGYDLATESMQRLDDFVNYGLMF
jgi:hypothetical protein